MNNTPMISFVVCVGETAEHALTTVKSLYTQDYPNIEAFVYYCSPYLNENTLITPLLNFPICDNIHLTVEKSAEPRSRAQAMQICAEKVHGEYVCFLKENSVFSSEDTVSKIVGALQRNDPIDALLLPCDKKSVSRNVDPGCIIIDLLLYNYPHHAAVFKTDEVRSAIAQFKGDIYELLPEALFLQMQLQKKNNSVCTIRNSAIVQKNAGGRELIQHLVRRDVLELLKTFFIDESLVYDDSDEYTERMETYYANLNYYCALYNVTHIESKEEIQTLCLRELAREVDASKNEYEKLTKSRKKAPLTGVVKTRYSNAWLKKILTKMYQSGQMIFFTLVLAFNLLLLKSFLIPHVALALCCVLWSIWSVIAVLFVISLAQQGITQLRKFRAWLRS